MINELHAAITLRQLDQNNFAFWDDYVDPEWFVPNTLPRAFYSLRETFLVSPEIPEACAWRSYEFRSLLDATDFRDMRLLFDQRDGYYVPAIMSAMVDRSQLKKMGDIGTHIVSYTTPPKSPSYQVYRYQVTSTNTQITLSNARYGVITGEWGSNTKITLRLDADQSQITFSKFLGTGIIEWAAMPTVTLSDVSKRLVARQETDLSDMVKEESVLTRDQRELLAKIAADDSEIGAQIVAAGLLLAGCVKHHVSISSRVSA